MLKAHHKANSARTGYLKLELPVFHIGYFKSTVQILQCICKGCSRVLLPEDERRAYLRWGVQTIVPGDGGLEACRWCSGQRSAVDCIAPWQLVVGACHSGGCEGRKDAGRG